MIDAEVFGGVVTNIEKLLTPRQKKRLNHNIMKRAQSNNIPLAMKRTTAITNASAPQLKRKKK